MTEPIPVETRPEQRGWPTVAIVLCVVFGLLAAAATVWAVTLQQRLTETEEQVAALQSDLEAEQQQVADLEQQLEEAQAQGLGALEDLFGGAGGAGGLEDLLGELFGGDPSQMQDLLEGLFGGEGGDASGLQDLFEGLFGGSSSDGLGGLFGGPGTETILANQACLMGEGTQFEVDDSTLGSQYPDISAAVETVRGLEFTDPIEPTLVSPDEMEQRIATIVAEDYPAEVADIDSRLLASVGAVPPGYDLIEAQSGLLGSGVAGFYDSETGELVVRADDGGQPLDAADQVTLAHELTHALTDAQLEFPPVIEDEEADPDAALAALALLEGDATVVMQRYATGALDPTEQLTMALDPAALASAQDLGEYPYYLGAALQFPYTEGIGLVCALLGESGDWEMVDRAYDDPPTATAEVLFPDRYEQGIDPVQPESAGSPGAGWAEARRDVFGAADVLFLLQAPGDDPEQAIADARDRVAAWNGGEVVMWTDGPATAVAITLVDGGEGSAPLCETVVDLETAAFPEASVETAGEGEALVHLGEGRTAVVSCDGASVTWGIAPDLETARALLGG